MKTETIEEPKSQVNSEEEARKLMIDRPSDFRFHVAYLAYSKTWDNAASQEVKTKLNEIILSLSKEEISFSSFYKELDQFRRPDSKHYAYPRKRIETQRKRDWRKKRARKARNARYSRKS